MESESSDEQGGANGSRQKPKNGLSGGRGAKRLEKHHPGLDRPTPNRFRETRSSRADSREGDSETPR